MKDLFLMIPLGLGDCLVCNGLIRSLVPQYEKVYVPCWTHNTPSVKFMFSDIPSVIVQEVSNPNEIFIQQVQHEAEGNTRILKLGCYSGQSHVEPETFDQTFYRQAGVEFSKRWDGFKLPEISSASFITPSDCSIAFICDSDERGFRILDSHISNEHIKVRTYPSHMIFDFIPFLRMAKEIHCINSAFAILADSIPTTGKLFMHRYARPYTPYDNFKVRKPWTILP